MFRRLLRHPGLQVAFARLLGLYLDLALRTTRWTIEGTEHLAPHAAGAPCIAAFWHERLPLIPILWHHLGRGQGRMTVHVLVSRHRDGRFIGEIIRSFGVRLVHGSTSRDGTSKGGAAGQRALLAALQGGDHVAITPDGPRGPRREATAGVAQLAALAGVPVLPLGAQTTRRHTLHSWDRMVIPLPFGRGALVCGRSIGVPRDGWEAALPDIARAMTEAADRADALCGR
jgi:lysophospholipid acyltransferase (LPLAT)-like uncharacterized protein